MIKTMWSKAPIVGLAAVLLIPLFFNAWACFWADSESWILSISGLHGELAQFYDLGVKPLFTLIAFLIHETSELIDVHPMYIGRMVFSGLFVVTAACILQLARRLEMPRLILILLTVFLLFSEIILERAYRVRSDLLVLPVFLFWLDTLIKADWKQLTRSQLMIWIGPLIMFFITPKSIILILSTWSVWLSKDHRKKIIALVSNRWLIFLYVILVLILGALFFGVSLIQSVLKSVSYFALSFGEIDHGLGYFSPIRFEHLVNLLQGDWLFSLLLLFKLSFVAFFFKKWKAQSSVLGFHLDALALSLLVFMILYPNRMPFHLASYYPIWVLFIFNYPTFVKKKIEQFKVMYPVVITLLVFIVFTKGLIKTKQIYTDHNHFAQKKFIFKIEEFLSKRSAIRAYDPSGLIQGDNIYYWYLGPAQEWSNRIVLDQIQNLKPEIVIGAQRLSYLWETELKELMNSQYTRLPGDIWIQNEWILLDKNQTQLNFNWLEERLYSSKYKLKPGFKVSLSFIGSGSNNNSTIAEKIYVSDLSTKKAIPIPQRARAINVKVLDVGFDTVTEQAAFQLLRFDPEL